MSIEPFKKKKKFPDLEADGKPFVIKNDLFNAKESGASDAKINGVGEMKIEQEEKSKYEPTPPSKYDLINEVVRDLLGKGLTFGSGGGYGFTAQYNGPLRRDEYRNEEKVSLETAIRRELELCRMGRHSIGFHVARMLSYIRQYYDAINKSK